MSSGRPVRLTGSRAAAPAIILATRSRPPMVLSSSGVLTIPGAIALTRIGDRSIASARANTSTAPQEAEMTADPGRGLRDAVPVISVIDPSGGIFGAAYLAA